MRDFNLQSHPRKWQKILLWGGFVLLVIVEIVAVYRISMQNPIFYHDAFEREHSNEAIASYLKIYGVAYAAGEHAGTSWNWSRRFVHGFGLYVWGGHWAEPGWGWTETIIKQRIIEVRQKDEFNIPITKGEQKVLDEYHTMVTMQIFCQILFADSTEMSNWEFAGRRLGECFGPLAGLTIFGGIRENKEALSHMIHEATDELLSDPSVREYWEYRCKYISE